MAGCKASWFVFRMCNHHHRITYTIVSQSQVWKILGNCFANFMTNCFNFLAVCLCLYSSLDGLLRPSNSQTILQHPLSLSMVTWHGVPRGPVTGEIVEDIRNMGKIFHIPAYFNYISNISNIELTIHSQKYLRESSSLVVECSDEWQHVQVCF